MSVRHCGVCAVPPPYQARLTRSLAVPRCFCLFWFLFKCSFKDSQYEAPCYLRAREQVSDPTRRLEMDSFFKVLFAASFFFYIKKSGSVRFDVQHFFSGHSVAKWGCRCEWLEFWLRLRMLWADVWEDRRLPSVCPRAHVCVLIYQSWQYSGSAGQKRILESNSKPQALFQGI